MDIGMEKLSPYQNFVVEALDCSTLSVKYEIPHCMRPAHLEHPRLFMISTICAEISENFKADNFHTEVALVDVLRNMSHKKDRRKGY